VTCLCCMQRITTVIARERRSVLNAMESHPHYSFATATICNTLYGGHERYTRNPAHVAHRRQLIEVCRVNTAVPRRALRGISQPSIG